MLRLGPNLETQPPPLLADYDGRIISETGGLRHPELSEPLAASLRHLTETELIQALIKEALDSESLLDLALIFASEGKNAAAAALVERTAREITGESDALRCSARLLASGRHELAGIFAAKLVTRITSTVMLSTIFNMVRRHCYQDAINSLRYESEEDVFALRDKLSALAFTLCDSKEPLLAKRLFGTSELDAYSLDCPDFTPRRMHPAPPSILGENDSAADPAFAGVVPVPVVKHQHIGPRQRAAAWAVGQISPLQWAVHCRRWMEPWHS